MGYNRCTKADADAFLLVEEEVEPYLRDYDADEKERPLQWPPQFDISNWGFFAAFDGEKRVGAAAVAFRTPSLGLLKGREDVASLWDIRVHPDHRGRGIGKMLFDTAVDWARKRGCHLFRIEPQAINVPACLFYLGRGGGLSGAAIGGAEGPTPSGSRTNGTRPRPRQTSTTSLRT